MATLKRSSEVLLTLDERLKRLRQLIAQYDAAGPWFDPPLDCFRMLDDLVGHLRVLDAGITGGEPLPVAWKLSTRFDVVQRVEERSDLVARFRDSADIGALIELIECATGATVEGVVEG